jgi:Flp pilus assembly protein TadD
MISLMLDYAIAGRPDNLRPFHRTSLALHAANTVLVIVLLYMLFGNPWVAAMVGLLFGVHPMTVETIPWIGERKTLLAAFFALWCLIVYVRYARRPNWKLWVICLVLYVLALISKPISTPLPVVMLLLDFWPLGRLSKRAVVEKLPLLAISVVFGAITVLSQGYWGGVEVPTRYPPSRIPLILCHNIIFYLYKIVWPARLSSYYPFPQPLDLSDPMILAGVIGTCILIPALLISLRWTRALATGWLIFFVAIFPTMGVLGFTIVIASDKYAYLPAAGLLLVLAWLLERTWLWGAESTRLAWRIGTVVVVLFAASLLTVDSRRYLARWQTTEGLHDYMLIYAPNSPHLLCSRGNVYNNKGYYNKAIRDCTKAIELKPDFAEAYNNRGKACYEIGDLDQAIRDYNKAIVLKPDFALAYNNRGAAYGRMGDYDRAIRDSCKAIELKPYFAEAYSNRGNAYNGMGDFGQAIHDYTKAVELKPDYAAIYNNRAIAYFHLKQYDNAWADVKKCRQLGWTPSPVFIKTLTRATGRSE